MQIKFSSFNQIDSFQGTAKTFEDANIALNGVMLNQTTVGALARHGLLETVGDGPKPLRGRTPKIYRAVSRNGFVVQQAEGRIETKQEESTNEDQSGDNEAAETSVVDTGPF